jgi:LPS-assembly protein
MSRSPIPAATPHTAIRCSSATRCATASSRTSCWCWRTAAASRGARDARRWRQHAGARRLFALRVIDSEGCPKDPTWQVTALRIVHDPARRRISYRGARFNILGIPLIPLPSFSHPDGSGSSAGGLLVPDVRFSRTNGVEFALPYYFPLAPNQDLTITPHIYSKVLPALEARYRRLDQLGAIQLGGFVTHGTRTDVNLGNALTADRDRGFRGYFEANGRLQLDPLWSITAATRVTTDKTFLRRYDISRDDRLRTLINAERISTDSYVSIAGLGVPGPARDGPAGTTPIALPASTRGCG